MSTRTLKSGAQAPEAVGMKVKTAPEGLRVTTEEELLKKERVSPEGHTEFKIRDMESGAVLFEITKPPASVREMVAQPYQTHSDSFYFVENQLVMHNKADYSYGNGP
ncbi:protein unc-119 homolog A-like [Hypanus sabinus]|uniref:protein unc-119 homolog A-like n=1 Tax=Hypanus sabinus TaxID=79690 RepID=UPI0028C4B8C7|nr:protein unc-119 homolog A-like [Hypanus sabinus]